MVLADAVYTKARQKFLDGLISWSNDDIKVVLVGSGYSPDLDADEFLSDIPSGERIAISDLLSNKTSIGGVANADTIIFPTVTGSAAEYIVVYKVESTIATSSLIAFISQSTGLPITPNGADIEIDWDTGANKIFKL